MSENLEVSVTAFDRTAKFILTFDSDFQSDNDMRTTISRDGACEPEVTHLLHRVLQIGDVVVDTSFIRPTVSPDGSSELNPECADK